jgi:LmbE family N-acetylglucosaminyl deacetylase
MVVLAVGAHPDDVEFGCFGTLARLSKETSVHIITLSAGELGGPKNVRIRECKESAKLINAKLSVLNYPDSKIPVNAKIIDELRACITKIRPDIVFTLYPRDTHQDHRNAARVTISSCKDVERVLFYEVPSTENSFHPNVFYDVTDFFHIKEKSLSNHKTQRRKPYLNLDGLRGLARFRAYQCGFDGLFESFSLYREVIK